MAYGYEKSSKMQDKILDRMSGTRTPKEQAPVYDLSKPAWTPERWAHRVTKKPTADKK